MDIEKCERRLPSLLVEGNTSDDKAKWNELARTRYRLKRLKDTHPKKYDSLISKHVKILTEIKQNIEKKRT